MSGLKKVLKLVCKGVGALLLLLCMLFLVTSVSPIFDDTYNIFSGGSR